MGEVVGSKPKFHKPEGWDYLEEMIVRGSLLGPGSIIYDMYSAEQHGNLAVVSLMGPAFGKFVEFFNEDFMNWLIGMTPVLAQSRVLRDEAKSKLSGF